MAFDVRFEIRRAVKQALASAEKIIRGTQFESIAVAQFEPSGLELTRMGRRYHLGNNAAVTGIAPVQVLPTTTTQWVLYNTAPAGGRVCWIEALGMYLTSGTPGVGGVLLACLFKLPVAANQSMQAGTAIGLAADAKITPAGSVLVAKSGVAVITDPAAPVWMFIANNPSPNVTAFASSVQLENRSLAGRLAIPPQMGLGLAVVAPAGTTPLYAPFAEWVELESDLD